MFQEKWVLAATARVALLIVLLSVRTMEYKGEQCSGGDGDRHTA